MKIFHRISPAALVRACAWLVLMTCGVAHAASLTWNAGVNSTWDTATANWTGSIWTNNNDAFFGANGVGTVTLGSGISANSLTFNTAGYTLGGSTLTLNGAGTISANANAVISSVVAGDLAKTGGGTLTLTGTSDMGSMTLGGGVLDISGNAYNNWTAGPVVTVNSGAILRLYGWGYAWGGLGSLGGQLVVNGGTIEMAGNNSASWLSRDFSIGANGATLLVDSGIAWNVGSGWPSANPLTNNSSLTLAGSGTGNLYMPLTGTGSLTKTGTGTWILSGTSDLGNLTLSGGVLDISGNAYNNWRAGPVVTVNSGATLRLYGWGYAWGGLGSLGGPLVVNGGTIEMAGSNSANWLSRDFSIGANGATLLVDSGIVWNVGSGWPSANPLTNNTSLTLAGSGTGYLYMPLTGTGSLTKAGTGTWTLLGALSYTGATVINQGTLICTGSLSGPLAVNANFMLGADSTTATLTVANTMTLTGTATMRLGGSGLSDKITGMTSVSYGGALVVTNPGNAALANGSTYTLFAAGSYSGTFTSITLPLLTSGLVWDTSNLTVNGSIRVRSQSLLSLVLTPSTASVAPGGTQQFTVVGYDQFGVPIGNLPSLTWSCIGQGAVNGSGLFTASYSGGAAVVTVTSGSAQASAGVTVSGVLPMGWKATDTGSVGVTGGSSYGGGVYTVNGSGADIWGSADAFQFNSKWLNGDGEIRARVASQANTNASAKAGVMMRSGTGAGAVNVFVGLTPSGFVFQYRSAAGGATSSVSATANAAPNNWVRLVRSGTLFTAYVSANGTTWTQIGTPQTISMNNTLNVGLAVSSHNNAAIGTATFDNLSVIPFPAPWQTMDIGNTVQLGSAEYFNGVYTVKGAGTVSGNSDSFRFLYQSVTETSSEIIARISTLQNTSTNNARLGVMIRSGTSATSPYAFMGVSGAGAYMFQTRSTDGGSTTTTTGVNGTAPNIWVRVVRSGNSFSAYYKSSAGGTWTQVGTTMSITIGSTAYIGIVDASGNTTGLNTSVFDNVGGSSITSTPSAALQLTSFESAADFTAITTGESATASQSTAHVSDGSSSLRVDFPNSSYPGVKFPTSMFAPGANWATAGALMFDACNTDSQPMNLIISFYDASGKRYDTSVTLPPGIQQRVAVGLHQPNNLQIQEYPWNYACNSGLFSSFGGGYAGNSVSTISFWLSNAGRAQTVYFDNFWLVDVPPLDKIIDAYGQFVLYDWPGKIHSDSEEVTVHATEAASLAAQIAALQGSTDRDSYGGWAAGPQLAATGWFRTQKLNGKWWLVTPTGHFFWSTGLDCVWTSRADWLNSSSKNLFSWFPAGGDPLAALPYYWGTPDFGAIDFYQMNLYRAYGANWLVPWQTSMANRMTAWGFNTVGAWSDDSANIQLQKPFTVVLVDTGGIEKVTTDIFSSPWVAGINSTIHTQVTGSNSWSTNPRCLGYFVNNEIPWPDHDSLPVDALGLSGTYAVKGAFTTILQNKYTTIGALNTAWGIVLSATDWASFQANPVVLPAAGSRNAALEADLSLLLTAYANQYYSTVAAALKLYAPNQLYLGSRMSAVPPDEVAISAGNYCDVVTYNVYGTSWVIPARGEQIVKFNKPVIIGEFHFVGIDRGLFVNGMVQVGTQQQRGQDYADYINTALAQPWCVGAHWFRCIDSPFTDGGNDGFISVGDVPFPELVSQATTVNLNIYNTRNAAVVNTPAMITPSSVTGNSANLSVSGGDLSGGTGLKYTWTVTGTAPGTVTFTPNGTTGAANTTATFTQPGTYHFRVTITDALGNVITSDLGVSTHDWTQSTITLNGTVIAGSLLFGNASPNDHWTVNTGAGGPLTLSGTAGSPTITANNQPVTLNVVLTGTQGVVKSGTGTLIFTGANTYTGNTDLNSGVLDTGASGRIYAGALNTSAVVTLYPLATLRLSGWGSNTPGLGMLDCGPDRLVVNGGTIEWTGASAGSGSRGFTIGPVGATLKASGLGLWTLSHSGTPAYDTITNNSGLILDGSGTAQLGMDITGTGSLTKTGSGTWILTGSNSHAGATTVSQGNLQLLGSLAPGSAVVVSVTGTLSGTGALGGPVTVNGILAPGTGSIGSLKVSNTLTLAGTVTMRISKSGSTLSNDSVLGMSAVSYGGALVVSNIGGSVLAEGDMFTLFTSGSYTGAFSSVTLPALTGNLIWDTSKLAVNGSIKVTVPVVPPAAPAGFTATAGNAQVALDWSSAVGATGYNVKRSTVNGSNYVTILNNTAATSYNDTGLTNWTTYYYVVSAINAGGEGTNSTQAAAQPQSPPISAAEKSASSKISISGSAGTLTFKSSVIVHTYQLQTIDSLTSGTWINVGTAQPGTGADLNFAVPYDNSVRRRFYRLQIRQ
jgi:autotransporter-associated beta strand protein